MDVRRSVQVGRDNSAGKRAGNSSSDESTTSLFAAPKVISKLRAACDAMIADKGSFTFFALLLPESDGENWDLIASSSWLKPFDKKSLDYVYGHLAKFLSRSEMTTISRVVVADPDDISADPLTKNAVSSGITRFTNCNFLGVKIRDGFVFESNIQPRKRARVRASA